MFEKILHNYMPTCLNMNIFITNIHQNVQG